MARRQIGREITSIALTAMFVLQSDVFNVARNADLKRENSNGIFELILSHKKDNGNKKKENVYCIIARFINLYVSA